MLNPKSPKLIVSFRRTEAEQILSALDQIESAVTYYGIRKHYIKRHNDIRSKLVSALSTARREGA